jgi:hypothetical protein
MAYGVFVNALFYEHPTILYFFSSDGPENIMRHVVVLQKPIDVKFLSNDMRERNVEGLMLNLQAAVD